MKKAIFLIVLALFIFTASDLRAQPSEGQEAPKEDKPDHDHQTYGKFGFAHTESKIESFLIVANGVSVDVETYFNKNHAGFSGWFVGYRKDDVRIIDFGHMFNGGVLRTIHIPGIDFKFAGGAEWGSPALDFNKTRFHYQKGRLVSYEHIFLKENSNVPKLKPSKDALFYPFAEVSLLKRWERFLVEGGVRGNVYQRVGFDRYHLNGDILDFVYSSDKTRVVPTFFVKFGFAFEGNSAKPPKKNSSEATK